MIDKKSVIEYYAIIVGGGSGSRMQSEIPKQFMLLNGRPVLMHTIEAFHYSKFQPKIIVVLNAGFHSVWKKLCLEHNFAITHELISGGDQRFHSVKKGLEHVKGSSIVAIHDAVRPCISPGLIDSAYKQAGSIGNAVTAIKSRDSIRQKTQSGSIGLNRENIYLIQTPQVFTSEDLQFAYKQEYRSKFTDDASVVEMSGKDIYLIDGDPRNLKITFPEDLIIAGHYLAPKK